jgi:hypothetical protein
LKIAFHFEGKNDFFKNLKQTQVKKKVIFFVKEK